MNCLVLGAPGSGKSYLAEYFKKIGLPAYDADYDVPGLARWSDSAGNTVSFPEKPTVQWLKEHTFTWDRDVLERFLQVHEGVWIFGIAENAFEQCDLFDKCVYLTVNKSVLRERLLSADRMNQRGKTEDEVEQIWHDIQVDHLPAVKKHHIELVDATLTPERVLELLKNVS